MKTQSIKLFLCALCISMQSALFACGGINQQVYAGKIEYKLDSVNPLICTITVSMDFDITEDVSKDTIWVAWGDESTSIIHAVSITEDTVASANMGSIHIYTHVYSGTHTYSSLPFGGYYYITFQNEYRINGVTNIEYGDGVNIPFNLVAQVGIDTSAAGQYTPLYFPPLSVGFAGFSDYSQSGKPQVGDNNDSIVYSLTTPLEAISNPVPQYLLPDQFCVTNGSATDTFNMNPATGGILWTSPCLEGIYGYACTLNRYRNGQLLSSVMCEQNIYVLPYSPTGIQPVAGNSNMSLYPNPVQNTLMGTLNVVTENENKLEILSPDGRVVKQNIAVQNGKFETDLSMLAPGIYFVHLQGTNGGLVQRFVKQ